MKKNNYFRWLRIFALIYALIGITFYFLQDYILFHPRVLAKKDKYAISVPNREINIPYDRQTNISIVQFLVPVDTLAKGVVLYFHGNRENIGWYAKYAGNFTSQHYEAWMIDYPGFGKSTGTFSEEGLYRNALEMYRLARTRFKPSQIVIYGKSMGTGIATQLASVRDCRYLILETPYYSMASLVSHYLPIYPVETMLKYRFPNDEYLPHVTAPVVILHGMDDGLIPLSHARKLERFLKPGDEFVAIPEAGHNTLNSFAQYHRTLDSLLSR